MPEVSFIGQIEYAASIRDHESLSISFAIVPGNSCWILASGSAYGETQTAIMADDVGRCPLNHPIDVNYSTSSAEGWPFFICEVWDKSEPTARNFVGCGSCWLPPSKGEHALDINLWKPASLNDFTNFLDKLIPSHPDVKKLREVSISAYLRPQVEADSVGSLRIIVNTVTSGFEECGVLLQS